MHHDIVAYVWLLAVSTCWWTAWCLAYDISLYTSTWDYDLNIQILISYLGAMFQVHMYIFCSLFLCFIRLPQFFLPETFADRKNNRIRGTPFTYNSLASKMTALKNELNDHPTMIKSISWMTTFVQYMTHGRLKSTTSCVRSAFYHYTNGDLQSRLVSFY